MTEELLRVFGWLAIATLCGAVLAGMIDVATSWRAGMLAWPDPDSLFTGGLLGYFSSILVVPLLWRRRLLPAIGLAYGPAALVGVLVSLALGAASAGLIVAVVLVVMTIVAAVVLPDVFARPKPGHCAQCGYNLRGNPGAPCPECGADVRALQANERKPDKLNGREDR